MVLNRWQLNWFELQLRKELFIRDGSAFQVLFTDLMKRRYREQFATVCPWGAEGDWKNDGYLTPKRQLFQCYAPRELKKTRILSKIRADARGAFSKWSAHIDEWIFVHNVVEGVPPFVLDELLKLSAAHAPANSTSWGFEELWQIVRELTVDDNEFVFGQVVADEEFASLEFRDIISVMESVAAHEPPKDSPVAVVPPGKIEANQLPSCVVDYLQLGMRRAKFVDECFKRDSDPLLGDKAAKAFNDKYKELKAQRLSAAKVYDELRSFAGGGGVGLLSSRQDAAVLAVLAYFFERCDIFEAPSSLKAAP